MIAARIENKRRSLKSRIADKDGPVRTGSRGCSVISIYHQVSEAHTLARYRLFRDDCFFHKRAYRSNRAYIAFRFRAFAQFLAMALQQ
jgi:hypothetical protein